MRSSTRAPTGMAITLSIACLTWPDWRWACCACSRMRATASRSSRRPTSVTPSDALASATRRISSLSCTPPSPPAIWCDSASNRTVALSWTATSAGEVAPTRDRSAASADSCAVAARSTVSEVLKSSTATSLRWMAVAAAARAASIAVASPSRAPARAPRTRADSVSSVRTSATTGSKLPSMLCRTPSRVRVNVVSSCLTKRASSIAPRVRSIAGLNTTMSVPPSTAPSAAPRTAMATATAPTGIRGFAEVTMLRRRIPSIRRDHRTSPRML